MQDGGGGGDGRGGCAWYGNIMKNGMPVLLGVPARTKERSSKVQKPRDQPPAFCFWVELTDPVCGETHGVKLLLWRLDLFRLDYLKLVIGQVFPKLGRHSLEVSERYAPCPVFVEQRENLHYLFLQTKPAKQASRRQQQR